MWAATSLSPAPGCTEEEYLMVCRLYIEQYSDDASKHGLDAQEALKPIIDLALEISKLQEFTGRDKPTVIT